MIKKSGSTLVINHRMNDREKKLFRILFQQALPDFHTKSEHFIRPEDLLQLWDAASSELFLERAFWNLGATITYHCKVNPQRPSWGTFALFYGRSIKENGMYRYAYNNEFKSMINSPIVHKELLKQGLFPENFEHLPVQDQESAHASIIPFF